MARDLDIVVFGATGFVGRLVSRHLAEHAPTDVRIGLAGRSADRLAAGRADLGPRAAAWPLLVADTRNPASLAALAEATRVVATTVGPYLRYGLPLVEACARAGTDYVDLAAEVLFMRDSIDRFHDLAVASSARIVHSCGFDSIPSDLGVLLLHERARADDAGELEDTTLVVASMKGGLSGGTIDSARAQIEALRADPALSRLIADPYALSPDRAAEPDFGEVRDTTLVSRDTEAGVWTGPFVMAASNTRTVRRSNALSGWAYGRRFQYREVMSVGNSVVAPALAVATAAGLWLADVGMRLPLARTVLDRVLPAPGEGPSEKLRREGHFRFEIRTRTSTGARYRAVVAANGDPGYAATSVMLGQSALCLAVDRDRLPAAAGVLTPATALGIPLVDRLRAAGFELTVERVS
jgi:short subunit dehydrogenase-like uncharacterized protein